MKTLSYVDMPEYPELWAIVFNYFGDEDKVRRWFETGNPLLGGYSPATMLSLGRGQKLLKCVCDWTEGNHA